MRMVLVVHVQDLLAARGDAPDAARPGEKR